MYFSGPFERNYVAPNITKEKILSLKVGDDKKTIIKSFGYPGDVEFPNRNISEKLDAKYDEMFIYASKGLFGGFKFHIVFRGDKLIRAHIKLDGEDVYECQGSKCPGVFDQQRLDELCELSRKSGH